MMADQPLVVYPKSDNDKPKEVSQKSMDNLYERWAAKRKETGGIKKGEKISLSDYLNNKIH